jgi:hypothetical protein
MSLQCASCGRQVSDNETQCECGFNADKSFIAEHEETGSAAVQNRSQKNIDEPNNNKHTKKQVIKEIDSWKFIFSSDDNCIYLGTPALQSFKLKLKLNDLEELLEFMYHETGQEKTTRKLKLSVTEVNDFIGKVHTMIEEKKSKVTVKFSDDELKKISELINTKLKA